MQQTFTVTGMQCEHCEKSVQRALLEIDPHARVAIDRQHNRVDVQSDSSREALAQAIRGEGYDVAG